MMVRTGTLLLFLALGCGRTIVEDGSGLEAPPPDGETSPPGSRTVVTGRVVNLRQGPGTVYPILGRVYSGDTLVVTGEAEDWYRVYLPERSLFAWVYSDLTEGADLP